MIMMKKMLNFMSNLESTKNLSTFKFCFSSENNEQQC